MDRVLLENEKLEKDRTYKKNLEARKLRNMTFNNENIVGVSGNHNVETLLKEINRVNQRSEERNYMTEKLNADFGDFDLDDDDEI